MATKKQDKPLLPYKLRMEIWNMINDYYTTQEIVDRLYEYSPPEVSEGRFRYCIRGIKGAHTQGLRPKKR
ncbi:MAG: hypothetical protein PVH02_13370 [Desulfobacteraceae bacterium]|jgi:hypothetical protein